MDYYLIGWIAVFFLILLIEGLSQQLFAIWFAFGALIAIIMELTGLDFQLQLIFFIVASIIAMLALRPYVKKRLNFKIQATNSDENIGKYAVVMEDFNPLTKEGRVLLEGLDWAAKCPEYALSKDEKVLIKAIEGVKLIVARTGV